MQDHGFPHEATEATLQASRALLGIVARSVADALEQVTLPQFRVLVVLAGSGAMRMGALAARVGAVPSTFSRTIDRMVDGGWVVRQESPQSRREILVDLSDDGRRLVDQVTERRRRQVAAVLTSLTADEQQQIIDAMELFSRAAGEPTPEDLLTLGL
ncbi:transcriptional regulator [Leifsonia sp. LS1]|uniref:MarR family winged helix-turn-helix transcriptional regulator n=1 Tax=unclassified Leifsonia TaxID=2663824 RepID=UPI001CC0674B|nr:MULTISPECIES: MarR family transcriptional regulator [unclassified Leifsonia]UAJ78904.1 MarR family transcriptional regulator [Leifsonia sp. ZF2019]GIT79719.1 transcriptional regulator [Leifsonia sp. LS1]